MRLRHDLHKPGTRSVKVDEDFGANGSGLGGVLLELELSDANGEGAGDTGLSRGEGDAAITRDWVWGKHLRRRGESAL
jgi:hypothetical protein